MNPHGGVKGTKIERNIHLNSKKTVKTPRYTRRGGDEGRVEPPPEREQALEDGA
jgi:hypothetical protein